MPAEPRRGGAAVKRSDAVFFLSGAAALCYQVVWARMLGRLVGSDSGGIALVLFVFMAGMGAGSLALAGLARRARDPRRLFAGLLLALAAWAALSPRALALVAPVEGLGARALLAAAVLLAPTAAMGATFPLMGRLTIADERGAGRSVADYYGANTLGAAAGALLAPFALLPALGLSRSIACGAALDAAAALLALGLAPAPALGRAADGDGGRSGGERGRALAATLLLGASSLALEVLLTRLLVSVTGASVYAFAIVLAVFLLGLGLGGRQAGVWLQGGAAPLRLASRAALGVPVAALLGLVLLRWQLGEADVFGAIANRMPALRAERATLVLWASHALFAGLALFPPAVLFGMALPFCAAAALADRGRASRERALGEVYALNTAGAALGTLGAGLVLLPELGPRLAVAAALVPALAAALLARPRAREAAAGLAACALLAAAALRPAPAGDEEEVLYHRAGRDSTVTVAERPAPGDDGADRVRALRVDGKVVATTAPVDLRLQRFLGVLPAALVGDPETAVVIGLGTGMTAGSLLAFPGVQRVRVLEISRAVVDGAREFAAWNLGVVDDPRVTVDVEDGRHALALDPERYDVVTSDPIHPWTRGSSDLYALEHFRRMAARLTERGVASQWLPLYQLGTEDVRTVVATWCAAFPHAAAYLTAYDLVLLGAPRPLPPAERAELPPAVLALLAEAGVHSPEELGALRVAGTAELRALAGDAPPMMEDSPRLEFRAPLSFLAGYSREVLRWAAASPPPPGLSPAGAERARAVRALLTDFLGRMPQGLSAAADRYGDELLRLPPLGSG